VVSRVTVRVLGVSRIEVELRWVEIGRARQRLLVTMRSSSFDPIRKGCPGSCRGETNLTRVRRPSIGARKVPRESVGIVCSLVGSERSCYRPSISRLGSGDVCFRDVCFIHAADESLFIVITTGGFLYKLISVILHYPGTVEMNGPYKQKARYADISVHLYI